MSIHESCEHFCGCQTFRDPQCLYYRMDIVRQLKSNNGIHRISVNFNDDWSTNKCNAYFAPGGEARQASIIIIKIISRYSPLGI